jgi:hypothetical protein
MILVSKEDLTQAMLHEYLDYDPATGHLTWRKKLSRKTVIGKRAGTKVKDRHNRIIKIFGHVYIEHRIIWFYVHGHMPSPDEHIDHINHCESDNRISNLRLVTQAENNRNNSLRSDNALGVTGVWYRPRYTKKPYAAEIRLGAIRRTRSFATLEAAAEQRLAWEKELGFHPNHGSTKIV